MSFSRCSAASSVAPSGGCFSPPVQPNQFRTTWGASRATVGSFSARRPSPRRAAGKRIRGPSGGRWSRHVVEELRIEPLDQEGLTDSGSAEPTKLGGVGNPPLACGAEGGSCGFRTIAVNPSPEGGGGDIGAPKCRYAQAVWTRGTRPKGRVRRDRVLVVVECG